MTAKRAAEAALARAKDRLDLALEASDVALWDWHVPSDSWHVDERFRVKLGASGRSLTSVRALREISHLDELAALQRQIGNLLDGRCATYKVEHRLRKGYGVSFGLEPPTRALFCGIERGFAPTPKQVGLDFYRAWRF